MHNRLLLGVFAAIAMTMVMVVIAGTQLGRAAGQWQVEQVQQVENALEQVEGQFEQWEQEQLDDAWARGDDATAQAILRQQEQRRLARKELDEQIEQARVDAGLPPTAEPPPPLPSTVGVRNTAADRTAHLPWLAAGLFGVLIAGMGLVGAVVLLRLPDNSVEVEADEPAVASLHEQQTYLQPDPSEAGHQLNPRSQLRGAVEALRDAEILLDRVADGLEAAAQSWTGGAEDRKRASASFAQAIQALNEGGLTVDPAMADRAQRWPTSGKRADQLREERDDVVALLGVVRFLLAQERRH